MFIDEARLMAQLRHPNVVRVGDISRVFTEYFFTMELVYGESLLSTLRKSLELGHALPLAQAVAVVLQAAEGLDYAHRATTSAGLPLDVVHRDVSPANVLIDYDGNVKLADFGVARATNRTVKTGERIIKGKIGYMSPEQALCKPVDPRSDVFALGIVLYEATTSRKLFKGESDYEVLTKIVEGCVPLPSSRRSGYPANLENVVMRALERDPASRYATVRELITALSRVAHDLQLATDPETLATFMRELHADLDEDEARPRWPALDRAATDTEIMMRPPSFTVPPVRARLLRRTNLAQGTPSPDVRGTPKSADARRVLALLGIDGALGMAQDQSARSESSVLTSAGSTATDSARRSPGNSADEGTPSPEPSGPRTRTQPQLPVRPARG
jgi:serine/threonine protein kinase